MSDKTSPQTLINECVEDLLTYLRAGRLGTDELARGLSFTDTEIGDFRAVKETHFALSPQIAGFLRVLGHRIRRLNTKTSRTQTRSRGGIEGRIDWQATYKSRAAEGGNRAIYEAHQATTEYDLPENLVVKRLLTILERIDREHLSELDSSVLRAARWNSAHGTGSLRDELQRVFHRDVHIRRISTVNGDRLTERDLSRATSARQPLYRDAVERLREYRRLMNDEWDEPSIRRLLEQTLLSPGRTSKLFELFCAFGVMRALRSAYNIELQPLRGGEELFAALDTDEYTVDVYWDRQGPLAFAESTSNQPEYDANHPDYGFTDQFTQRYAEAASTYQSIVSQTHDSSSTLSLYPGRRPDLLATFSPTSTDDIDRVLLGEVKYRTGPEGFRAGLKDLVRYMQFARSADYLLADTDVLGVVVTDGSSEDEYDVANDHVIHLTTESLITQRGSWDALVQWATASQ